MRKIIGYTLIGLLCLSILYFAIEDIKLFILSWVITASVLGILILGIWLIQDKD